MRVLGSYFTYCWGSGMSLCTGYREDEDGMYRAVGSWDRGMYIRLSLRLRTT